MTVPLPDVRFVQYDESIGQESHQCGKRGVLCPISESKF